MDEQPSNTTPPVDRPKTADSVTWGKYSQALNQPWRTEQEISKERQEELTNCLKIVPDIEKGIYPFNKNVKLSRADIEWLLATHENGRGPVEWDDENQRNRKGLDLRGADLRHRDLSDLPLACMLGGLKRDEWLNATPQQREMAAVRLDDADLREVHLERAVLTRSSLKITNLRAAHLESADLLMAKLNGAYLIGAYLEGTSLRSAHLEGANLTNAHLEGANLHSAFFNNMSSLENATLGNEKSGVVSVADVRWGGVNLSVIDWSQIKILGDEVKANLKKTSDGRNKKTTTRLREYQKAIQANRQLALTLQEQGLNVEAAHFAYRAQINQRLAYQFELLQHLGKHRKLQWLVREPLPMTAEDRDMISGLFSFAIAILGIPLMLLLVPAINIVFFFFTSFSFLFLLFVAYYLLSSLIFARLFLIFVVLSLFYLVLIYIIFEMLIFIISHPEALWLFVTLLLVLYTFKTVKSLTWSNLWSNIMNIAHKIVSLFLPEIQRDYGRYIFSLFLDILAGYGYKPGRTLFWYVSVIIGFATVYSTFGHLPLMPDAFVYSVTSFHGRGFFPGPESKFPLQDPKVWLASIEAVVGLILEISFIATFTQRYFGK